MNSNFVSNLKPQIILIIISLIKSIVTDCGLPGIPPNAKINSFEFIYSEDTQIEYYCELPELVLLNGKTRTCKNGRWLGSIPFCAEEIVDNPIDRIEMSDRTGKAENNSSPITSVDGKAFFGHLESGECIGSISNSLKPTTVFVSLRRKYSHLSYFEVVLHTGKSINSTDILLESVLNPMRVCMASVVQPSTAPSYLLRLKFICDYVSNTDDETEYVYYAEDFTQNITLKLDTNSISICEIRLFYRRIHSPHQCGSPDAPIHSSVDLVQFGSKYGEMPNYRFTCDDNFELVGNQDVRCGVNNYWLDPFPACVPKVKCPPEVYFDLVTVKSVYINFYTFDGKETAIPGSQIIYSCDESQNTKVMVGDSVRVCTETGHWSGIQPYCLDLSELKLDKYSEIFDQKILNETNVKIGSRNESSDCGLPAMPIYAKPSPSRYMSEDFRTHYPNGTKIQIRCEEAFHMMYSRTKARKCINRKWTGSAGKCEISHGGNIQLSSIIVTNHDTVVSIWPRPEPNENNTNVYGLYYENAFGAVDGDICGPFNVTDRQEIVLKLNDSLRISSFMLDIKPGGMYGGYTSHGASKNITIKPLIARVGSAICDAKNIYDYSPHSTYVAFICDETSNGDYSSVAVDEVIIYTDPKQFDKKFDPKNVSLCSLTLFYSSQNCGIPDRPLNSIVRIDGQIAYYTCEEGFELIGANSVMCLPNGEWAQEFPICKLKHNLCPKISHNFGILWQYTNAVKDSIIAGTLVNSQCPPTLPGFEGRPLLIGSRTRVCLSDGKWSGSKPFCIDSSKYKSNGVQPFALSTKALIIIICVSVSTIIVILLIILIVCCHLTEKCYQCCSLSLNRHSDEGKSDVNQNNITVRPESQVDISEINETLNKLANFRPNDHQATVEEQTQNNNS